MKKKSEENNSHNKSEENDSHNNEHRKINELLQELLYLKNDSTQIDSTNDSIHEITTTLKNLQETIDTLNLSIQDIDNDFREVVDMIFQEQKILSERITKLEGQTKELKKNQPNTTWSNSNNRYLPGNIQVQNERKWYQLSWSP